MFIFTSSTTYFLNSYGLSVFYTVLLYIQMILIMSDKSMMKNAKDKLDNIKPAMTMIALIIAMDYLGRKGILPTISL